MGDVRVVRKQATGGRCHSREPQDVEGNHREVFMEVPCFARSSPYAAKHGAGQVGRRGRLRRGEEAMGETWSSWLLLSVFESRGWLATTGPAEHNIGGQQHTCACDFYCPRSRSRGDGERRTTRRPSRTAEGAKAAWSASESKFRGAARGVQAHRYCGRIMACGS